MCSRAVLCLLEMVRCSKTQSRAREVRPYSYRHQLLNELTVQTTSGIGKLDWRNFRDNPYAVGGLTGWERRVTRGAIGSCGCSTLISEKDNLDLRGRVADDERSRPG